MQFLALSSVVREKNYYRIQVYAFKISLPTTPIVTASLFPLLPNQPGLSISAEELAELVKRTAYLLLPQAHGVHGSFLTYTPRLRYMANLLNNLTP